MIYPEEECVKETIAENFCKPKEVSERTLLATDKAERYDTPLEKLTKITQPKLKFNA